MAYLSYDTIKEALKRCEGKTLSEAMVVYDDWAEGFIPVSIDTPSCGDGAFDSRIRPTTIGIRAQDIVPSKPTPPSTPQTKEPDTEHMWDMLVLAARSSRYGE
jgi:hypothetical protein